ncbi:MAG: type IV pilus twitching motility protein PilT [bacterium]
MEINALLKIVVEKGASDLIIVAGTAPILKVNGALSPIDSAKLSESDARSLIYGLLNPKQIESFESTKELDCSYEMKGTARFRVNVHYQRGTVAAALRLIPSDIPSIEDLRLPKVVTDFANLERGLVLVTGPTGSGKTTTQACMIDLINQSKTRHVITIEDPIEYIHKNKRSVVEQREVGIDTDSFNAALKRVLRQAPDVILIGEMRDLETIQTAITAAETGHLVISTLHTNDAVQSIDRIVDVFPPHQQAQVRIQLSLSLQGIIAQQLVAKLDNRGMTIATEVLIATSAIRNLIRKASTQEIYSMLDIGAKYGMQSMDTSLKNLCKSKIITYEEALAHAINQERFEKL